MDAILIILSFFTIIFVGTFGMIFAEKFKTVLIFLCSNIIAIIILFAIAIMFYKPPTLSNVPPTLQQDCKESVTDYTGDYQDMPNQIDGSEGFIID